MKLLLLDLDGTVRETISSATFINEPTDQKLIAGVGEAIAQYSIQVWQIIGISNQGGVKAKFKSLNSCLDEQRHTLELLSHLMTRIYICPDDGKPTGRSPLRVASYFSAKKASQDSESQKQA